jgi:SAM-dependent methyltransferase
MGDWIAFWDSDHSIYVNARHKDVHYRAIAQDVLGYVPEGARVLDYGCGEALHADLIAPHAKKLLLCDAAPSVRAALAKRFAGHGNIAVLSPNEVHALPQNSIDVVVMHSVAQYLTPAELDALLALFRRLCAPQGLVLIGDVIPPHLSAIGDAIALLRFAAGNGFLGGALSGLTRTLVSDYWRLRSKFGLTRYAKSVMIAKLAEAGFSAKRAESNIGHNQARMTFVARPEPTRPSIAS